MKAYISMYFGNFIKITKIQQFEEKTNVVSFNDEMKNDGFSIPSIGHVDKIVTLFEKMYSYGTNDLNKWESITINKDIKIDRLLNPTTDFLFVVVELIDAELHYWFTDMQDWYKPLSVKRFSDNWPYRIFYSLKKVDAPPISNLIVNIYDRIVGQMQVDYKSYFDKKK